MKHTLGPWKFYKAVETNVWVVGQMLPDEEQIARVTLNPEANARLIAAAPELLAILERLVFADENKLLSSKHRAWEDARAAIAKAGGDLAEVSE